MIVEKDFLFWSFHFSRMDGPHKRELCVLINLDFRGPCIVNNLSPCSNPRMWSIEQYTRLERIGV